MTAILFGKKIRRKSAPQPSRATILNEIKICLEQMYSWGHQIEKRRVSTDHISHTQVYACKAQALIELLEVHDCGSIGGFDPETNPSVDGLYSLEERYAALKRKRYVKAMRGQS